MIVPADIGVRPRSENSSGSPSASPVELIGDYEALSHPNATLDLATGALTRGAADGAVSLVTVWANTDYSGFYSTSWGHTEWLDCTNCHDKLFLPKAGATPVNMFAVLQGEYCGRCHGAVSFPLT